MKLTTKTLELVRKTAATAIDSANRKLEDAKQRKLDEQRMFWQNFPYKHRYTITPQDSGIGGEV